MLLAAAVVLLLIPRSATWALTAIVLVVPVAATGVRRGDLTFFSWAGYVVSFAVFLYVRDVADAIGPGPFFAYPIVVDQVLGFGQVPTISLQAWHQPGAPRWWDFAALAVYLSYFLSVPIVGLVVWRWRPRALQPLLLGMAAVCLIAAMVHIVLPTAPPWIAGQAGVLPVVYRPVVDLLGGLSPGVYQYGLTVAGGNDVAAMPSVHTAAAVMTARSAWGTRTAVLGSAYAGLMGLTLIYLGEHYLVDVLAGGALALYCWRLASRFQPPF